jgi:hypothetical protein
MLYLPESEVEFEFLIQEKKTFYANYIVKLSIDPNLQGIQLRGPPHLS